MGAAVVPSWGPGYRIPLSSLGPLHTIHIAHKNGGPSSPGCICWPEGSRVGKMGACQEPGLVRWWPGALTKVSDDVTITSGSSQWPGNPGRPPPAVVQQMTSVLMGLLKSPSSSLWGLEVSEDQGWHTHRLLALLLLG